MTDLKHGILYIQCFYKNNSCQTKLTKRAYLEIWGTFDRNYNPVQKFLVKCANRSRNFRWKWSQGGTYHICIRGCSYGRSNSNPKIWVHWKFWSQKYWYIAYFLPKNMDRMECLMLLLSSLGHKVDGKKLFLRYHKIRHKKDGSRWSA